MNRIVKAKS